METPGVSVQLEPTVAFYRTHRLQLLAGRRLRDCRPVVFSRRQRVSLRSLRLKSWKYPLNLH